MKTWLLRGTRRFAVDPRRRFGRSGGARRLLSTDGEVPANPHGAWGGLISALQRHTVHGELAHLAKEDRQILSLAYLSGHTNREIAAMLHVSMSTVRRRLSLALARLEESMRRAGVWVSALALAGLALYSRMAHSVRDTRWPSTVAVLAAGTATAVTLGVVAVSPPLATATQSSTQAHTSQPVIALPTIGRLVAVVTTTAPDAVAPDVPGGVASSAAKHASTETVAHISPFGCHGNPTNAPPTTPVGTRGPHPGAPVTHPGKGGCGPHAS
ncbi:MAG TPA: RNA polymerase sigma factor [Candidatus Dormibacteraeota bacterium]|nr:RNA polymerase sigma factor [Candidatus Dormibacteraeota bacterium]